MWYQACRAIHWGTLTHGTIQPNKWVTRVATAGGEYWLYCYNNKKLPATFYCMGQRGLTVGCGMQRLRGSSGSWFDSMAIRHTEVALAEIDLMQMVVPTLQWLAEMERTEAANSLVMAKLKKALLVPGLDAWSKLNVGAAFDLVRKEVTIQSPYYLAVYLNATSRVIKKMATNLHGTPVDLPVIA